jgi:hypothetical protein
VSFRELWPLKVSSSSSDTLDRQQHYLWMMLDPKTQDAVISQSIALDNLGIEGIQTS